MADNVANESFLETLKAIQGAPLAMLDVHVSECLDRALANQGRACRVNLAEMPANAIKTLAAPCEQRTRKIVTIINSLIPTESSGRYM